MPDIENNAAAAQAEGTGKTKKDDKIRVLFSLVGKRDPYSETPPDQPPGLDAEGTLYDYEGSVLTVCRKVRPDILYLFPSGRDGATPPDNHTQDKAEEIKAIVKEWTGGPTACEVRPLNVANPANVEEVYGCFKDRVLTIIEELMRNRPDGLAAYKFFVDTTSGTPQMSEAARLYLANSLLDPTYCQCLHPDRLQGGERVVFPDSKLPELVLLKQIDNNVDGYQFHSLVGDCESLNGMTKVTQRQTIARMLKPAFEAYEAMDFMQYNRAFLKISQLHDLFDPIHFPRINAIMEAQKDFLEQVKEQQVDENVYNLVDLYFNMERAFARGNYVDVLARFWRLREGMMYYRLRNIYGIDQHDFADPPNLGALVRTLVQDFHDDELNRFEHRFNNVERCVYIDPHDGEEKEMGVLKRLRLARNYSIVAHGMAPVQEEEAKMCLKIGKEIIKLIPEVPESPGDVPRIPGGQEVYDAYPFTLEKLRTLADMLKRV